MNANEIDSLILTDIKSSNYYLALCNIRESIHFFSYSTLMDAEENKELVSSMCSAFSALYHLAGGIVK
jgi:hypothetical protein